MKTKAYIRSICLILCASFLILAGCNGLPGSGAAQPTSVVAVVNQGGKSVTATGHILPAADANLSFLAPGQVTVVHVKNGETVKKGDVLVSLGDREAYQAAVSAAEFELANAQRQYDDLQNNATLALNQAQADLAAAQRGYIEAQQKLADLDTDAYTTRLDNAQKAVSTAKDDLKTAQEDFDKVKNLDVDNTDRKNADTKLSDAQKKYDQAVRDRDLIINEMDDTRAHVNLTKAQVDDAQRRVNNYQNGPDPADLTQANARLKNAKDQLTAAQASLSRLDLVAPYDGTVVKVDVSAGDTAVPNQPVLTIADFSKWYVETSDLTEKDVTNITAGQKVTVVPDAFPDAVLTGVVESIGEDYVEKSGDITYVIRIPLDTTDLNLRWGMTVTVTFPEQ